MVSKCFKLVSLFSLHIAVKGRGTHEVVLSHDLKTFLTGIICKVFMICFPIETIVLKEEISIQVFKIFFSFQIPYLTIKNKSL